MRGGKVQRSQRIDRKMNKAQEITEVTESAEHGEDGDHGEASTGEANAAASTHQNALLEGLTSLTKELVDFKQVMRRDLGDFKNEIKKAVKDDFAEFKEEVLHELQVQNASIAEAQTRIADLESASLEMKDTLLMVVKQNMEMRDKIVDLESRSRRNNIRIY